MTASGETRYAKSGDVQVAYAVLDNAHADLDLVYVPGFVSHVEVFQEDPHLGRHLRQMASFSRLLFFDKRGTGMSDPWDGAATLDERMDDIRAVMDAAGFERAALFAVSEGGPLALTFAATYPERVSALVLYGTGARFMQCDDYPHGPTPAEVEAYLPFIQEVWGVMTPASIAAVAPSMVDDEAFLEGWTKARRVAASPKVAADILALNVQLDVREVLAAVSTPTLVLHRTGDRFVPVEHGRYLAEHIPGAELIELDGNDHMPWVGDDGLEGVVEEFLTGERRVEDTDRALATVLFTDIVGSTERAGAEGDRRWRELLDQHDTATRREVERLGGRAVKSTGDGFLATFDRPGRAIEAAQATIASLRGVGLEIRAGIHTGEIELRGDDVGGIAVHIGARVGALAAPGEILVSSTVRDLVVGSAFLFDDRGMHALKGVPGEWRLLAVA